MSVIIPTFDRASTITRAVMSVLRSATDDVELIVVDDGSEDDTVEVLGNIDDHRLSVVSQPNCGVSTARNRGAAAATGRFLVFLDSDDEARDGWVGFFRSCALDGVDLATCGVEFSRSDPQAEQIERVAPPKLGKAFGGLQVNWLAGGFGISAALFQQVGGYLDGLRYSENTELGLRVGARHLVEPISTRVTSEMLLTVHTWRSGVPWEIRFESARVLLDQAGTHLARDRRMLATYEGIAGVAADHLGRRPEARAHLMRAIRARPLWAKAYARIVSHAIPPTLRPKPGAPDVSSTGTP